MDKEKISKKKPCPPMQATAEIYIKPLSGNDAKLNTLIQAANLLAAPRQKPQR